ncbi:MAG TPA: SDR family NAD(P)-dependent oxidoreductase [Nitriliruptorales bacterium]
MLALVTGASRGIGRAVAIALAEAGHDVVATMRKPEDGTDLADHGITVERLDVTEPDAIAIPDGLGILVNNAGVEGPMLPVEHHPISDWRWMFETNVFGLLEVTRRAIPAMRANGAGVVVNVTTGALPVAMPFYAVYRASKAAVGAMSESLRAEMAPFGIRVLEVVPGPIDTDMLASSGRVPEAVDHGGYEELAKRAHAGRHAVDPMTTPVDEAAARIVAAIEDPDVNGRVACDSLGQLILTQWARDPASMLNGPW